MQYYTLHMQMLIVCSYVHGFIEYLSTNPASESEGQLDYVIKQTLYYTGTDNFS